MYINYLQLYLPNARQKAHVFINVNVYTMITKFENKYFLPGRLQIQYSEPKAITEAV